MLGKKLRVKSEVVQLGYISPWKLQQETSRNDLQMFLSKNQQHQWAKTQPKAQPMTRTVFSRQKRTARTLANTTTDFRQTLQRSYNRKFYSKSASLHKRHSHPQRNFTQVATPFGEDQAIFAKRCRQTQKPKLITIGNSFQMAKQKSLPRSRDPPSRIERRKKEFLLKKQSFTQGLLKNQIVNQKEFIISIQNCLLEMEKSEKKTSSPSKILTLTMKKFLTHYKKL